MNDLDLMNLPTSFGAEREIYDPVNAWPDAPSPVTIQIHRLGGGVYQVGYDSNTGEYWVRTLRYGDSWSPWAIPWPKPEVNPPAE